MKKKISKILGVVLSLALLSSLAIVSVPVAAVGDPDVINEWEPVAMPNTLPHSDVGPMTIAPDGTIYATVAEWVDDLDDIYPDVDGDGDTGTAGFPDNWEWLWSVKKSIDGGFTWTTTELSGLDAWGDVHDVMAAVDIQCSPNYDEDGRIYVAFLNGDVYRMTDEGEGTPILLKEIEDELGNYISDDSDWMLYDIDLWSDGESVWILVACSLDVLVLEDTTFAEWLDQDLSTWEWDENAAEGEDYVFYEAYECAYAPDFDTSSRLWAIMGNWSSDDYEFELWAISTISPGQWGQDMDEVHFETPDEYVDASPYVDLAFPEFYSEETPVFYAALTEFGEPYYGGPTYDGNLFLVQAAQKADVSEAEALLAYNDYDVAVVSVEVAGEVILAGGWGSNTIYRSENMGSTWDVIGYDPEDNEIKGSGPTGSGYQVEWWGQGFEWFSWTHVYMVPGFDAEDGVAYVSTVGGESAVSRSNDGGVTYQQVGLIDTEIVEIHDVAFSPEGGSQPAMLLTVSTSNDASGMPPVYVTGSMWRSLDIDAEEPMYERVAATGFDIEEPWNSEVRVFDVEYALDGSAIMAFGVNVDSYTLVVWKSTDDGKTFSHWRTMPVWINEWVVLDGSTIYCATPNGFYGTSRFGPPTSEEDFYSALGVGASNDLIDIALQPGFDPDAEDMSTIIVGNDDGEVFASPDAGDNWGYANEASTGYMYVDFDADFANNGLIYTADSGSGSTLGTVSVAELVGTVADFDPLEDETSGATATGFFTGLVVAPGAQADGGNALYAMSMDISGSVGTPASTASGGSVTVKGDDSGVETTESVPATEIDLITGGPFEDTEVLTVIGSALIWNDSITGPTLDTIFGTIVVSGAISGAVGQIDVTLAVGTGWSLDDGETVSVIGSSLIVGVAGAIPDVPDTPAQLWRLLLHDDDNIWETVSDDDLIAPISSINTNRLWLTPGTNLVWTIDNDDTDDAEPELWVLDDTLCIPVTGVTVSDVGETTATVSWNALTGADDYEYRWENEDEEKDFTDDTEADLEDLTHNTEYAVRVRAAPQPDYSPYSSRWSTAEDFTTLEIIAEPVNVVPIQGMQDAPLLPSFLWKTVDNAVSYEFELSTDPAFGSTVVATVISAPTIGYTCTTELIYDQNYYWRVRAVSATGTKSTWCVSNFHTMMEPIEPQDVDITLVPPPVTVIPPDINVTVVPPDVIVEPPPVTVIPPDISVTVIPPEIVVDVEVPPPVTVEVIEEVVEIIEEEITPAFIWIIVAIGAVLTIAVIVLIIRTRRVV